MLKKTSERKVWCNSSKQDRKVLYNGEQPPPSFNAGRSTAFNGAHGGWEFEDDPCIDRPTDFKHVMGISSQTFQAIKIAEKELFTNMSESKEFLQSKSNEEINSDSLGVRVNQNGNHRSRINVVQEREIHGGGFLLRTVEIIKLEDETVGIAVKHGNDWDRKYGVFISRLVLGSIVESSGLVKVGDEILYVNGVDVNGKTLDEVFLCLKIPSRLLITLKIKQIGRCAYRSGESRSASNSPRRSLPGRTLNLLGDDYRSKTIPRPSSAQSNLAKSGRVPPLQRFNAGQKYEPENDQDHNCRTAAGSQGPSRSRYRSATASEVLSGGSSSELSPRDTSFSERDLSPTLGPEVRIQPDEDSDSMVFVDDELEESRPSGSFNDIQNLRKSAPAGSSGVVRRPQQHRPYSTIIPANRDFIDSAGAVGIVETDERLKTSSSSLRHVSSSDDIHEPKLGGHGLERDLPYKMTRQNSSPLGSPQAVRRRDESRFRKMAGLSLNLQDKQIFSIFKETTRKISKKNSKGSSQAQGSHKQKYVPKPSPEKRLRRISSNKPLDIDLAQFVKYKGDPGPRSRSPLMEFSGILTLHLHGGKKMVTRKENRDLYCVIEVDSLHKAQTSVISGQDEFCWDEKFEIDLEQAHHLCIMIYSYSADYAAKQKLCYRTLIRFNNLLTQGAQTRSKDEPYSLALRLEPRGVLYATLSFAERSATLKRVPSLDRRGLFGVPIDIVVRRECSERNIPLIIQKCVEEIELRGLQIVGIYRVCGSSKKKKRLHDEFEKASALVDLSFENFPDINIITGVLKDYLRELPEPLFTPTLCERLISHLDTPNPQITPEEIVETMVNLPPVNKETVEYLLDHLKAVNAYSIRNRMDLYNIAVCFGPVLMSRGCAMAIANGSDKGKIDEYYKFQTVDSAEKHIELLQSLLKLWPARTALAMGPPPEETKPPAEEEEEAAVDNQEEDSCYHSNDDLDEGAVKDMVVDGEAEDKEEELKGSMQDVGWDADHLEVSAC